MAHIRPGPSAADRVYIRHEHADDLKRPLMPDFRDISKFAVPRTMRAFGVTSRAGVVNDTAKDALENTASGIDGLLFGGAEQYTVKLRDERLNDREDVKAYAAHMAETLNGALRTPRSGFESARQKAMQSAVGFGVLCIYSEDRPGHHHLSLRTVSAAKLFLLPNDEQNLPSGVQVKTELTARAAVDKFKAMPGSSLPQKVLDSADDEKRAGDKFEFIHEVRPDPDGKGPFAFRSSYVCTSGEKHMVAEGGYHEQPYHVARWMGDEDSPWGWSPGHTALPTIKRVNTVGRTDLKAGHRIVEPAFYTTAGAFKGRVDRRPDKITFMAKPLRGQNPYEIREWPGPKGLAFGLEIERNLEERIHKLFYSDLLDVPLSPSMTATEYLGRVQQMMRRMGSPVGNIENELALPLGRRGFNLLWRARAFDFDAMPDVLRGLGPDDFQVEFISPLERAQKAKEAESILHTAEGIAILDKVSPGARDLFDGDAAARRLAAANRAPEDIIRDVETVTAMRDARAQAASADTQVEMAERAVDGLSTLAQAQGALRQTETAH